MMRVLIVDLLLLGDVINAAHVAASLKEYNSFAEIDLLTYSSNKDIAGICTGFDEKVFIDRQEIIKLISKNDKSLVGNYWIAEKFIYSLINCSYDLVLNLTHNKISAIVCSLINKKEMIGATLNDDKTLTVKGRNSWIKYFNDFVTSDFANSFQYIDVIKKAINVPLNVRSQNVIKTPIIDLKPFNEKKYFIIKPTTSEFKKDWSPSNYSDLASKIIRETGFKCLLVGVESDKNLFQEMIKKIGKDASYGFYNFNELTSIIKEAEFVIGGDTGVLHLAAAMNKKTVTITLGSGTFYKSTPYGKNNIILYPKEDCYPCPHITPCNKKFKCHGDITVNDVFDAVFFEQLATENAGVVKTYFNNEGFCSYKTLNILENQIKFNLYHKVRQRVIDYLDNKGTIENYDVEALKRSMAELQIYRGRLF